VAPKVLNFGTVKVNSSKSRSFIVKNVGKGTLEGDAGAASPTPPFSSGPTSFSLKKGKAQKVSVKFAPTSKGNFNGSIVVHSGDPNHPTSTVTLKGKGK
jgi:hypothetical protein